MLLMRDDVDFCQTRLKDAAGRYRALMKGRFRCLPAMPSDSSATRVPELRRNRTFNHFSAARLKVSQISHDALNADRHTKSSMPRVVLLANGRRRGLHRRRQMPRFDVLMLFFTSLI